MQQTFNNIFGHNSNPVMSAQALPVPVGAPPPPASSIQQPAMQVASTAMSDKTTKKNIVSADRQMRNFLNAMGAFNGK
jgi:hypothetical protein